MINQIRALILNNVNNRNFGRIQLKLLNFSKQIRIIHLLA